MTLLVVAVSFLFVFGLIVFILLFGESPQLRNGIVGKANRILTVHIPQQTFQAIKWTVGPRIWSSLVRGWQYTFESRNPFLQVFFMVLTSGSIYLFLMNALQYIPGVYLHRIHLFIIPVQIISLYVSYYVVCTADPGIITRDNIQHYIETFEYDGLLYEPKKCSTCQLQKPARSKHCSMCKACIGRLDHHCFWINRCVGVNNHRYFFYFLFTLIQFCTYGAYLCFQIYRGLIIDWDLDRAFVVDRTTGEKTPITFTQAMLHILHRDRLIGAIGILAGVVTTVVFIFTVYQLYLAARGVTTNEAFKWELVEDSIDRGELWLESIRPDTTAADKVSGTAGIKKRAGASIKKQQQQQQHQRTRHKVESLDELENIYDGGVYQNLYNIFFPPVPSSKRKSL